MSCTVIIARYLLVSAFHLMFPIFSEIFEFNSNSVQDVRSDRIAAHITTGVQSIRVTLLSQLQSTVSDTLAFLNF